MIKIDCEHYWEVTEDKLDIPFSREDVIIEARCDKIGKYFIMNGEACNDCNYCDNCEHYKEINPIRTPEGLKRIAELIRGLDKTR